jgi:GxxExxY protein
MTQEEDRVYAIVCAGMDVHSILGPGYSEGVYHEAMEIEMGLRDIVFEAEPEMEIQFKGRTLKNRFIPNFLVDDDIIVELKATTTPLSDADADPVRNSLKTAGKQAGLVLNFGLEALGHLRCEG